MKKVLNYKVEVTESQGNHVQSVRWSYFKSLREARSCFRACVNYYDGIQNITGSYRILIRLIKGLEKDEIVYIDSHHKYFLLSLPL